MSQQITSPDMIEKLSEIRIALCKEIHEDKFSVRAKFSGGICLCGKVIQEGELITRPLNSRWIHSDCSDLDSSEVKAESNATKLTAKLADQAIRKQAMWRDDILELAKLTFLGEWSKDYWLEDIPITLRILELFGLHKLTRGWRFSSDKTRQKYAQKIEKEFAKKKGWVCRICRRRIWVEKSVERGIGPVCFKHLESKDQEGLSF